MNWLKALQEARTVEGVLDVVNDFLAQQPDHDWEWIPVGARPSDVNTEEDLHRWHHRLVQELSASRSMPNIKMQDLCVFFVRASIRAHQIRLRDREPGDSSNDTSFSASGWRRGRT